MPVSINYEKKFKVIYRIECFANIKYSNKNSACICIEIINNRPECVNSIGATTFFKDGLKTT